MNSNQKALRRMIQNQESTITDQELFLSSAYQDYLTSLAQAATGRYRRGLQVIMSWDESEGADIASTNNYKIQMNAANPITQSLPSRYLRSQTLAGLCGHEVGHLLYTDFTSLGLYLTSMTKGAFYPQVPTVSSDYQQNLDEIMDDFTNQERATCVTLAKCASLISNILEDVYIEARICDSFPGVFRQGIQLINLRSSEQMLSIQEQIDKDYSNFSIMANLLVQYCVTGGINNLFNYSGPYLDYLEECVPYIEDAIYTDEGKARFHATNHILILLWEYIKPMIEQVKEDMESQSENEAAQSLADLLSEQVSSGAPLPSGKNGVPPKQAPNGKAEQTASPYSAGGPQTRQDNLSSAQEVLQAEGNRLVLAKTTSILDEDNSGITHNYQYTGSGYEQTATDLFRILNDIATEKAEIQYQEELTEELQNAANDIHYGNAHKGVHVTVNRMAYVSDSLIKGYQSIATPLLRTSRRLQSSIEPLLKAESEGGKMKNLQFGKRLDMRAFHHKDGTFFTRTRLPSEEQKLAVGLLVDESGSMSDADRITHARKTAIVLYDFCKSLQIPITIYGHSTGGSGVQLYSYAEFDSVDTTDCYRLMDMSSRGGNRDGAALRYVAEYLDKRSELQKLLIIISDGQPADCGYYGTEAEADLRGIKKEYEKKGITLFAAAIGADKENIKRIYQEGFLDITSLENLPKNMTLLVKQYLQ